MSDSLAVFLAQSEGHCCVHSFLVKYNIRGEENLSLKQAAEISLKLGVSWRTVYNYNKSIREGLCKPCDNCRAKELL
jgi:hypothetical protein